MDESFWLDLLVPPIAVLADRVLLIMSNSKVEFLGHGREQQPDCWGMFTRYFLNLLTSKQAKNSDVKQIHGGGRTVCGVLQKSNEASVNEITFTCGLAGL